MCAILIIINLLKTNALEDEHLLSPDKIYLCQKELMDQDSPKRTIYSSPTLKFLFKKLTYFIQPKQDQFWLSSPMGWVPLPRSFPISWYCKLDTGMQEPNVQPELQMQ